MESMKRITFLIIFLITFISLFVFLYVKRDEEVLTRIKALGYQDVIIRSVTFKGYESEKISASKNNSNIFLQVVKNVTSDSDSLLEKFRSNVIDSQKNLTVYDPYSGKIKEFQVPEEIKTVKEEIRINDKLVAYYLVYVNEIFSPVISKNETKFKGLISMYYCEREKTVYNLEIYFDYEKFDKNKAFDILRLLFCR